MPKVNLLESITRTQQIFEGLLEGVTPDPYDWAKETPERGDRLFRDSVDDAVFEAIMRHTFDSPRSDA